MERITEAELALARLVIRQLASVAYHEGLQPDTVRELTPSEASETPTLDAHEPATDVLLERLVAEVRRLRELIAEHAETLNLALAISDPPRDISGRELVEAGREGAKALLTEARAIEAEAIRAETKPTP